MASAVVLFAAVALAAVLIVALGDAATGESVSVFAAGRFVDTIISITAAVASHPGGMRAGVRQVGTRDDQRRGSPPRAGILLEARRAREVNRPPANGASSPGP